MNGELEMCGDYTVIALANLDPPAAMRVGVGDVPAAGGKGAVAGTAFAKVWSRTRTFVGCARARGGITTRWML